MDKIDQAKELKVEGLQSLIAKRWSPRTFSDKDVEPEKVKLLFEAARWAPSCYNEQPWTYILGSKKTCPETYDKVLSTLVEFNQGWAKSAPLLILAVAHLKFSKNQNENLWGKYDLGQASAQLAIQATHMGLHVHQMGGYDGEKARTTFNIPSDFVVCAAMAVGYLGPLEQLPEQMQKLESGPRERKGLSDMVVSTWGTPSKL